jgi:hypothetical protein
MVEFDGSVTIEGAVPVVTASVIAVPFPQALLGVTVILPDAAPAVTVILLVPVPAVIDHPAGTVHT